MSDPIKKIRAAETAIKAFTAECPGATFNDIVQAVSAVYLSLDDRKDSEDSGLARVLTIAAVQTIGAPAVHAMADDAAKVLGESPRPPGGKTSAPAFSFGSSELFPTKITKNQSN
jgi:hypothetical protein